MIVYVTGGARSGKSSFAEKLVADRSGSGDVSYLATAQALDAEMAARIARHRAARPQHWVTIEEPVAVPEAVSELRGSVLLDCLSLWVSNLVLAEVPDAEVLKRADRLAAAAAHLERLVVVSNEVGSGIVPDNALARRYRDLLGLVNQRLAAAADEAYLLASGLPIRLS